MRISFANGTRRLYILSIANRAGTNSRLWNERQIRAFCQEAPTEKLSGLEICICHVVQLPGGNQWVLQIINQLVLQIRIQPYQTVRLGELKFIALYD